MTAYGFRLFTLSAHPGRKHDLLDLSDLIDASRAGSAKDEMARHLTEIKDQLLFGRAAYKNTGFDADADADPEPDNVENRKHPYLQVTRVDVQGDRIIAALNYGREGDYEWLLGQDGSRSSLKQRASTRGYRVIFFFPKTGAHAVMVSETRGRTHAGEALIHWLRVQNQHEAVSFNEQGTRVESPFVRWSVEPFFDEHRIDDILTDSTEHVLTVKRKAVASTNDRFSGSRRLTQHGLPLSRTDDLKAMIRKWWAERGSRTGIERSAEAARDVAALIAPSDVVASLDFNDGEVSFKENGKVQTITPNTIERLFVYPLGESKPTDQALLTAATARVQPMLSPLKIEVGLDIS